MSQQDKLHLLLDSKITDRYFADIDLITDHSLGSRTSHPAEVIEINLVCKLGKRVRPWAIVFEPLQLELSKLQVKLLQH
jgi:hypothetical protein